MKLKEAATGVVEDAIEHDADALGMRCFDQTAQGLVAAQHRIDLVVIVRVIAMVARRLEDRRQVDRVDPQVHQMIQVLDNPPQITAVIALLRGRRVPRETVSSGFLATRRSCCARTDREKIW